VQVSLDGTKWSTPVAQGTGAAGLTVISFKPVQAKFVRMTETVTDPASVAWTMLNLRLYSSK
jgi:Tfp pilus assembly protein FimV